FTASGLLPGTYYARTFNSLGYFDGLYAGQTCVNCTVTTGTPITVSAGGTAANVNFALTLGGRISGQITDALTGAGLANVSVEIYTSTGTFATSTSTNATGGFTSAGLLAGTYYARTFNSLGYLDSLYAGQTCVNCSVTTGTPITVSAGGTAANVNFALTVGGRISGQVTDALTGAGLANVSVAVFTGSGTFPPTGLVTSASTNATGSYTV